ncbi:MAG: DUF2760 domain-containing protein [Desulfobacterales bacterium]
MDAAKTFSRRSFVLVFLFLALLVIVLNAALIYALWQVQSGLEVLLTADAEAAVLKDGLGGVAAQLAQLQRFFPVASAGASILVALCLWMFLRRLARGVVAGPARMAPRPAAKTAKEPAETDKAIAQQRDMRVFLHLLSVLQREGRLLDFFSENLEGYEDAQIGAAVRGIHENCQKALKKYLHLKTVITSAEGAEVTVEPGFDPSAIKLVGNVTGEPPFKGVLRHQGWRAEKVELPVLSAGQTPSIICPAEVEIA